MKWFKHSSLAAQDAKLKKLRIKYGMQGYGLYWYCLELIASEVDSSKLTFELEHDSEILAHDTGINYQVVQEMMNYMVDLGLFENTGGIITCFALAKRADEYLVKSLKREGKIDLLENIRALAGQTPDKVRPEESRLDKIRLDKKDNLPSQAIADHSASIEKWNKFAEQTGLQTLRGITPRRAKSIKSAYSLYKKTRKALRPDDKSEPMSESKFLDAMVTVAIETHDDFHLGKNDRKWKMNFDYLLQQKIVDRVTETGSIA